MTSLSSPDLKFAVAKKPRDVPKTGKMLGILLYNNWNDFNYYTSYVLNFFDEDGVLYELGHLRIASSSMTEQEPTVVLPASAFTQLEESYFSLGADQEYYENLKRLPKKTREIILKALRDMAFDDEIWKLFRDERVTSKSLLRGKSANTVRQQYHRIAHGGAVLTPFRFKFKVPTPAGDLPFKISFKVDPDTHTPPTNVHALIGRNGSGKTHALRFIAENLIGAAMPIRPGASSEKNEDSISGMVYISFSPFDKLHREILPGPETMPFPITRVSLHDPTVNDGVHVKSPEDLTTGLLESVAECAALNRYDRWQAAVRLLNTDPGFADLRIAEIEVMTERKIRKKELKKIFDGLSSGHKIVLLTLTRLIECTAEKSLVLIDEPETHLHPPLLSSFIRAVSEIMLDRNGVAIVATHSPVVLQEVPRTCVWKLERFGQRIVANRPEMETFGENVGTLTREVFGYEVMNSGFHRLLMRAVDECESADQILQKFRGQLGGEAQAIIHGLMARKNKQGGRSDA